MDQLDTPVRVLIVEDMPGYRDHLYVQLTQDVRTQVIGVAGTVEEASNALQNMMEDGSGQEQQIPDVILVDMKFRDANGERLRGPELIKQISQMRETFGCLDMKILCLSHCIQPEVIIGAIKAGANGYIDKLQAVDGWVEAIVRVRQGVYIFSPNVLRQVTFQEVFTEVDNVEIFTPPELQVSDQAKRVALLYWRSRLTAKEIGEVLGIKETTVWYHISRIRNDDRTVLALTGEKPRRKQEA